MLSYTVPAISVAEADAYFGAAGEAAWSGEDLRKQAAIMRGQRAIAALYNARWAVAFANDEAPENVKYAVAEAALRELRVPGSIIPDINPAKVIKSASVSGAVSVTYADLSATSRGLIIAAIGGLLNDLLLPEQSRTYVASFNRA